MSDHESTAFQSWQAENNALDEGADQLPYWLLGAGILVWSVAGYYLYGLMGIGILPLLVAATLLVSIPVQLLALWVLSADMDSWGDAILRIAACQFFMSATNLLAGLIALVLIGSGAGVLGLILEFLVLVSLGIYLSYRLLRLDSFFQIILFGLICWVLFTCLEKLLEFLMRSLQSA